MEPKFIGPLMIAAGLAALVVAEWRGWRRASCVAKPFASAGFIVTALGAGALSSRYGVIVLVGLALGALGDVFLLSRAKAFFVAGLTSFLAGHVAYLVAFASAGVSVGATLYAAAAMLVVGAIVARWSFPHAGSMRLPIGAYIVVIGAMCSLAVGAGAAGASWRIPAGAILFALSDISVVRDRFVSKGVVNRLWGLPLYYAAQLLIAQSVS